MTIDVDVEGVCDLNVMPLSIVKPKTFVEAATRMDDENYSTLCCVIREHLESVCGDPSLGIPYNLVGVLLRSRVPCGVATILCYIVSVRRLTSVDEGTEPDGYLCVVAV